MAQAAHDQAIVSPLDDPAAFRALYDEHFAHVWRTLRRLGVQAAHLEDAAHEVKHDEIWVGATEASFVADGELLE